MNHQTVVPSAECHDTCAVSWLAVEVNPKHYSLALWRQVELHHMHGEGEKSKWQKRWARFSGDLLVLYRCKRRKEGVSFDGLSY